MSKVVDVVGDVVGGILDITGVGALFSGLMPDQTQPEQDVATLAKGLQKGIDQPRRITFGRDRVGGVIAHQATKTRDEKEFIQLIILINGAPIDALEDVYIANKPLSSYPRASYNYAVADGRHTKAITVAVQKMAGWTDKHIGRDQAHIFLELENNREVFPDGVSDCEFLIRGARVWDPRDASQDPDDRNTWKWSQNAVLCTLHYVRFYGANQVPVSHLPMNWWIAAANVCDEDAEYTDSQGVTHKEPRYTINGTFAFTSRPLEVLQQLERSFAGKVFRQMGQWYVRVGAWYGAPTYTVTMADVLGDVKIKWHADLRERANTVRAQFVDPKQNYERTDAPPVIAQSYLEQDAQPLEQTLSLPFVRSSATAQRLAAIQLEQTRLGAIELPLRHTGLRAAVGRTIKVNIPEYHINNKIYRVIDRRFRLDRGVTIRCIEDSPGIWADGMVPGVEDLTPNTDYVPGQLLPVEALSVNTREDGYVVLRWEYGAIEAVEHFNVVIQRAVDGQTQKVHSQRVNYIEAVLPPLQVGQYHALVTAVNVLGKASVANALTFTLDVPTAPTIDIETTDNSAMLTADIGDAIGVQAEWVWLGLADEPNPAPAVRTPILTKNNLAPDTHYAAKCRAVTHKNKSAWAEVVVITKKAKAPVEVVDVVFGVSQQATWTALATNWLPPSLTNTVTIKAVDKVSKNVLSERILKVHLEPDNGLISIEIEDQAQVHPIELAYEGEGTNHLTITAIYNGVLSRQSFNAAGVTVGDINKIKDNLAAVDAVAESILEQAIADNAALVANLQSRGEFNQKAAAIIARIDEDGAVTQEQITLLQSSLENASATLSELERTVATEDAALSERVSYLTAEVGENKAQITTVEQALATETEAAALRMSAIESSVGDNSSKIVNIEQTSATQNEANAQRFSAIESSVGENAGKLVTVEQTMASEDAALSARIEQISSQADDNFAHLENYYYTAVDTDAAISASKLELQSQMDSNLAYLNNQFYTKSESDGAISSAISTLSAQVDGQVTAVNQRVNSAESDIYGNYLAINSLQQTAGNLDDGLSALNYRVGSVETTAEGNANAIQGLTSRVTNAENDAASAHLTLSAHANHLGQLEARAEIGVNYNGFVTGMDVTPGKVKFAAETFEWYASDAYTSAEHVIRSRNGGMAGFKNGVYQWSISQTGAFYGNYAEVTGVTAGSDTRKYAVGVDVKASYIGVRATAKDWAFYATQGEIGPHTSAHECLLPIEVTPEVGDILCDDELMHIANISNAICTAKLSSTPMEVTVRGIYTRRRPLTDRQPAGLVGFDEWEQLAYLYDIASFNAGGEGAMNVCGEGGNLQTGDLICASSMPGKGMRQPTQSEERYTLAQARHNVIFESADQVKQVAVIYKRG
ncbi:hypothetical protein CTT31_20840 [Pseudoalteromonas maricaloris]|uniref:phage tail protein n=1 Tax=Pseudoalteromonas maricaloris TaxID=184924 RepID=UPI0021AE1D05|nr:phage tail protein [Pseudoalteromonas flavipulchra]USE71533.1 hypothetical protein CTT31_20840 [Pseudoalteromonas flavipulchra]